jgi:transposase
LFCEPYPSNLFMYYVLMSRDIIESEIICHLPLRKRGFKPQAPPCEIINCILYKLKTGIQWHLLSVEGLFSTHVVHYKTVFGHYRRWCKEGDLEKVLDRTIEKV